MFIEYRVKPLLDIPLHWKTEIIKIDKPTSFTDRQVKGAYKLWEHTHTFTEKESGILMKDDVNYELPFWVLGTIADTLIVRKKVV